MNSFEDFKIKKQLTKAIADLGLTKPSPIQMASYSSILSGKDYVGIAQTGTGKTIAYLLPILQELEFSTQAQPRVLIMAPTRELVIQIVEQINKLTKYQNTRVIGVFGGSNNIKSQKKELLNGSDIIVGTPRRTYDLVLAGAIKLKSIKKMVIDEVDIMLDFGYRTQLKNIFELLPSKRQHILFSATMTSYVDELIDDFLVDPTKNTISISGTPLDSISQEKYAVPNFFTKVNLLNHLLQDKVEHNKVLIFVDRKKYADQLFELLNFPSEMSVIHSSKEQNHRTKSIEKFESGKSRILIATDVIARGIDIDDISTVINFDTPNYAENYIHRIGRTGRAGKTGKSILFFTEKEAIPKDAIETLMKYTIPTIALPKEVDISKELTPEESEKPINLQENHVPAPNLEVGASFHEKSAKNNKVRPEKKSYGTKMKERYKKPIRRGDKIQNLKSKRKKK